MAAHAINGSNSSHPGSVYSDRPFNELYNSSHSSVSVDSEGRAVRPLVPGVYVPTLCFFDPESEDLDTAAIASHAIRLAKAGVAGIATQDRKSVV